MCGPPFLPARIFPSAKGRSRYSMSPLAYFFVIKICLVLHGLFGMQCCGILDFWVYAIFPQLRSGCALCTRITSMKLPSCRHLSESVLAFGVIPFSSWCLVAENPQNQASWSRMLQTTSSILKSVHHACVLEASDSSGPSYCPSCSSFVACSNINKALPNPASLRGIAKPIMKSHAWDVGRGNLTDEKMLL